jgi:hypothetical protein
MLPAPSSIEHIEHFLTALLLGFDAVPGMGIGFPVKIPRKVCHSFNLFIYHIFITLHQPKLLNNELQQPNRNQVLLQW